MRILAVFVGLVLGGAALAAAPTAGAAGPCTRYAATPERVPGGDDNRPDLVHAAGGAVYCPNDVWVQITACVQIDAPEGWADVECRTSPRTHITPTTRGGRGQGLSFDIPCVSGVLRTHVTGGEGLQPTEWDSGTATIACSVHDTPADTTPPRTSILESPPELTRDASPSFVFRSSEAGSTFECRLDAPGWAGCTSPLAYDRLADGTHTFRVRATDLAGNLGAEAVRTFVIDTQAPDISIESGPSGTVADADATFAVASESGASLECRLDDAEWTACTSPATYTGLADGEHGFHARAIDAAGNTGSEATRTWTVAAEPLPTPTPTPVPTPGPFAGGTIAVSVPTPAVVPLVAKPDTTPPAITPPGRRAGVLAASRTGVVKIPVGTPQEDAFGTLALQARILRLGRTSFTARAGQAVVVRLRLSRRGSVTLRRRRRLAVQATVTLRDTAGNVSVTVFAFVLKPGVVAPGG